MDEQKYIEFVIERIKEQSNTEEILVSEEIMLREIEEFKLDKEKVVHLMLKYNLLEPTEESAKVNKEDYVASLYY